MSTFHLGNSVYVSFLCKCISIFFIIIYFREEEDTDVDSIDDLKDYRH